MEQISLPRKIALIGPMGCGKSKLARRLNEKYGLAVFDTDKVFTQRYGEIADFFASRGEAEFRRIEQQIMEEAAHSSADVIACGGGAVLNRRGMNALRAACEIVYLNAPPEVLRSRIERSDRPLKNDIEKILRERTPLYRRYADFFVDSAVDSLSEFESAIKLPRRNRYDVVLCDSDDTLLDFNAACANAVRQSLRDLGVSVDIERAAEIFRPLTQYYWGLLEKGEITREELFALREKEFADKLGTAFAQGEFNACYRENLRRTKCVRNGAIDFLKALKARGIKVYIITNADAYCANERLKPLMPYADGAFISESVGWHKPQRQYFEKVFDALGNPDKSRVIVFGDSETSDIAGGINYGIDTCLYGRGNSAADFTVEDYDAFLNIV